MLCAFLHIYRLCVCMLRPLPVQLIMFPLPGAICCSPVHVSRPNSKHTIAGVAAPPQTIEQRGKNPKHAPGMAYGRRVNCKAHTKMDGNVLQRAAPMDVMFGSHLRNDILACVKAQASFVPPFQNFWLHIFMFDAVFNRFVVVFLCATDSIPSATHVIFPLCVYVRRNCAYCILVACSSSCVSMPPLAALSGARTCMSNRTRKWVPPSVLRRRALARSLENLS